MTSLFDCYAFFVTKLFKIILTLLCCKCHIMLTLVGFSRLLQRENNRVLQRGRLLQFPTARLWAVSVGLVHHLSRRSSGLYGDRGSVAALILTVGLVCSHHRRGGRRPVGRLLCRQTAGVGHAVAVAVTAQGHGVGTDGTGPDLSRRTAEVGRWHEAWRAIRVLHMHRGVQSQHLGEGATGETFCSLINSCVNWLCSDLRRRGGWVD